MTERLIDQVYVFPRCLNLTQPLDKKSIKEVTVGNATMDAQPKFCYPDDMLCVGGGCELAVITRCSVAWDKFKKLLLLLISKHITLESRVKLHILCAFCLVI